MKGSCHAAGLMRKHIIGTRTKRDHYCNSNQSVQRPAPQKVNEHHGYTDISSCPETNFMLQVANLKVENKILKSVIAKHFMFCSTSRKNKPARNAAKPRLNLPIHKHRAPAHTNKPTNQITRYITHRDLFPSPTTQSNTSG